MRLITTIYLALILCFSPVYADESPLLIDNALPNLPTQTIKPFIVGGELAVEEDWPWVAALVYEANEISTSLLVSETSINSEPFLYSPFGDITAPIVNCGLGDSLCPLAQDKICLIARGEVDFSEKAKNCQNSGGVGAIIFNNLPGAIGGTLGANFDGTLPVIGVSESDGAQLLTLLNQNATININLDKSTAHSVNCGGSIIGDKWVLTAAHCVDDAQIEFLKVNVGAYDLTRDIETIAIKHIFIHPDYNLLDGLSSDIALIELVKSVASPAITPVTEDETIRLAEANTEAVAIGWGNTIAYDAGDSVVYSSQPNKLLQVELPLLSNDQCKNTLVQAYKERFNATYSPEQVGITEVMLCAHEPTGGKGSCQGDSGGPLMVNTNNGWQQVGIVSHGVGCGDAAFPEVYTRVSKFTAWIASITQGIELQSGYDFIITPQYTQQTTLLGITNHSDVTVNLAFELAASDTSNSGFSFSADNCQTLITQESCLIQVSFDAQTIGRQDAQLIMTSDIEGISGSTLAITAQAVAIDANINALSSNNSAGFLWFSGGDKTWEVSNEGQEIHSGEIQDGQHSSVLLTFNGEGDLSFDWAISSELNTIESAAPFDALFLFVDGELIDSISGEIPYTPVIIKNLARGEHQILWLYKKDNVHSEGEDKAYLKNVTFIPVPTLDNKVEKSHGGGMYFNLLLLALACLRRQYF